MALVFCDGLDVYDDQADVVAGGITKVEGSTHTHSLTGGRYGGGCIGGTGTFPGWGVPCVKSPGDTFTYSYAYYHDGNGSNSGTGDYWGYNRDSSGSGILWQLFHKADGTCYVIAQDGSTQGTSAAGVLTEDVWHWIEVTVTLGTDNSTGQVILKVDGTTVITTAATIDTYTGNNLATIGLYGSSGEWKCDDIIVNDASGSNFTTAPGDVRIETLRPTADGGVTDWTGSYADVDDAFGSSDGDTTINASTTAGQESRFVLGDLSSTSVSIKAVQPRMKEKNTDAGAKTVRTLINSSGTEALGTTHTPGTSYAWRRGDFFYVDPNTTSAFADAGINALQAGMEIVT